MKAYIKTRRTDWVLRRVVGALAEHAPEGVEVVGRQEDADLVILHVIGRRDRTGRQAERILSNGQRYAVVQYALRSTLQADTSAWLPLWRGAALTWSYYPLEEWCANDWTPFDFEFYHAPLGVDAGMFRDRGRERRFAIGTSGHSSLSESVREAAFATKRVGGEMWHLGPELHRGDDVICEDGLNDEELASRLGECRYVAGLRRTEGFELMAVEGLLCGARPVLFDRAHYRQWHEPWGVFIPETDRPGVIENLARVLKREPDPVTEQERAAAVELFDWRRIVEGFWERVV